MRSMVRSLSTVLTTVVGVSVLGCASTQTRGGARESSTTCSPLIRASFLTDVPSVMPCAADLTNLLDCTTPPLEGSTCRWTLVGCRSAGQWPFVQ
jgi:hypothetical protein